MALPRYSLTLQQVNQSASHEDSLEKRGVQISQCPSVWRPSRVPKHDSSVDIPEVKHPQRLEIVLESMSYQDGLGADELV